MLKNARRLAARPKNLPAEGQGGQRPFAPANGRRNGVISVVLAACLLCAVLLALALRLDHADLRMPLNYLGDAVVFLAKTKGILQGDWIYHNSRLGMPFGAELRDFPLNITFDSAIILLLGKFIRNPNTVQNVHWLLAVVATAGLAAYCLLRLGASRWVAVSIGAIYALSPHTFYRGISHLHSLFYLIPLLATGAIELTLGRLKVGDQGWKGLFRSVPAYLWLACIAAGFSYQYSAFFACFVLACATALAFLARRQWRECMIGIIAIGLIAGCLLVDMTPSFLYWAQNGRNPTQDFKYPAEAEIYGLKIRHLLTPVPNHPVPILRRVERHLVDLKFPLETENSAARLGTIGSAGFVMLVGFGLFSAVRSRVPVGETSRVLSACAALCLACVLLATTGGFGALFNAFVVPDVRCYNRIAPFISFFSLTAVAMLLTLGGQRWARGRIGGKIFAVGLVFCAAAAALDQRVISGWLHAPRQQLYAADNEFVRRAESLMPQDAMIFQLPYTDYPVEHLAERMYNNDQGRPYIHSTKCRWTWGAVSGTTASEWNRQAAALAVPQMLHRISHRGFAGIWVDLFGYNPRTSPEAALTGELGPPLRSANGRYLFYDVQPYAERLKEAERGWTPAQDRAQHPVELTFERGFYDEERDAVTSWHWSRKRGRVVLINPLRTERRIQLSMRLQTGYDEPQRIRIATPEGAEDVSVLRSTAWSRILALPPGGQVPVSFSCDCKRTDNPAEIRAVYFGVLDLKVEER